MNRLLIAGAAALLAGCGAPPRSPADAAVRFLWAQQGSDGGWHSSTYGLLRAGHSLTPFVLGALLEADPQHPGVDRAIAFLRAATDAGGALGRSPAAGPDYPNYATALAVLAECRARRSGWEASAARMIAYLKDQQFSEIHGWKPEDPPYGAWGMGGEPRRPPNAGHVDISMTRHVLQALAAAGVPRTDPVWERAAVFLKRCQNPDGGFFFSTVILDANKAGEEGGRYRSYGTTTADGILCLRALGRAESDPDLQAAVRWLRLHHRPDAAPGFVGAPYQRWTAGLRFYYAAAAHEAAPDLPVLLPAPLAGAWKNPEDLVKEDDPLIATGFALRALRSSLPPNPR